MEIVEPRGAYLAALRVAGDVEFASYFQLLWDETDPECRGELDPVERYGPWLRRHVGVDAAANYRWRVGDEAGRGVSAVFDYEVPAGPVPVWFLELHVGDGVWVPVFGPAGRELVEAYRRVMVVEAGEEFRVVVAELA